MSDLLVLLQSLGKANEAVEKPAVEPLGFRISVYQ